MSLNFPNSPTVGQTYNVGDRTWQWNGVAWDAISTGYGPVGPLDVLSDVVISSAQNGQLLQFDGTSWVNSVLPTNEPMGHEDKTDSTISFDNGSRIFTIAPVSTSHTVWCKGIRYVKLVAETITIPNTSDLYYIYYDASGTLSYKTTFFDLENDAPIAYVYWNSSTSRAEFFADERHGIVLDWQTHEYLHRTRGAAIASGFGANNYTIVGDGSLNSHAQIDLANGTFFDEDLQVDIAHSAAPVANTWQQRLQGGAYIPVMYRVGSEWQKTTATQFPLKIGTRAQYNLFSGGTWSAVDIDNNKFGVMYIIATNNLNEPVLSVMGQEQYTSQGSAEAAVWEDLIIDDFPVFEFRPLYKIVFETANAYANTPKSRFRGVYDLRRVISAGTSIPTTPVYDHGSMTGLSDDDHPQYFEQTRGDARYAQLGSANAFTVGGHTIQTQSSSIIPLRILSPSTGGQSALYFEVFDATNNVSRASINANGTGTFLGGANIGGSAGGSVRASVLTNSTTVIGLVVRGAASQTANLQEWQSWDGTTATTVAGVNSLGLVTVGGSSFTERLTVAGAPGSNVDSAAGLRAAIALSNPGGGDTRIVAGIPGLSNAGLGVYSTSTFLFGSDSNRAFFINGTTSFAQLNVFGRTLSVPVASFRGVLNQTADILQLRSGDTGSPIFAGFNALGQTFTGSTAPITVATGGATTAASGTGSVATITTTSAHGLATGDLVTVAGVTPTGYNGTYLVTGTPSSTQFTYANTTTGRQTVAGTVSVPAQASITPRSDGTVGFALTSSRTSGAHLMRVVNGYGNVFIVAATGSVDISQGLTTSQVTNRSTSSNSSIALNNGGTSIQTAVAANVALTVQNTNATPTGNLTEWRNFDGSSVLASVSPAGNITSPRYNITNTTYYWGVTDARIWTPNGVRIDGNLNLISGIATLGSQGWTGVRDSNNNTLQFFVGDGAQGVERARITTAGYLLVNSTSSTLGNNQAGANTTAAQFGVVSSAATTVGAVVRGATSQTANLMEWQNSAGTVLQRMNSGGAFYSFKATIGTENEYGSSLSVFPDATTTIGFTIRGRSSQTADLQQWQNNSGTVLGGANALAQTFTGSTAPITVGTGGAVSGTSSGTTATLTTASAHGLAVGDLVTIAGMTPSGYNGTYLVGTVPTTTSFTVTTSGSNLGNSTVSGTVSAPAQASITARSAGTTGLAIRAAASQVANTFQVTNSSGTARVYVDPNLNFFALDAVFMNDIRASSGTSNGRLFLATTGTTVNTAVAANVALTVQNTATPTVTGDLTRWLNNAGTTVASISPSGRFLISNTGSNTPIDVTADTADAGMIVTQYSSVAGNNSPAGFILRKSRGTAASPAALQTDDLISVLSFRGYNGSAFTTSGNALIAVYAGSNWSGSDNSTYMAFGTTPVGSTTRSESLRITASGAVVVNSTSSTLGNNGAGANTTAAQFGVVSSAATTVGAVVRGATSQTANLQEWQNSAGTVLASVTAAGVLNGTDIQAAGILNVSGSGYLGSRLNLITGGGTNPGVLIRGNATSGTADQTADLLRFQTGATGNAVLGGANALAQTFTGSTAPITVATGGATTAASGTGSVATITTTSAHGLATGDLVTVAGVTPAGYNGTYLVTGTPSSTQFTYANTTTGSQTVAGTVSVPAQASVTARSAGTVGLQVRAAASQVANLTEWRTSTGTLVSSVDSNGTIRAVNIINVSTFTNGRIQMLTSGVAVDTGVAANVALTVQNTAGTPTGNLTEWRGTGSPGTLLAFVDKDGGVSFSSGNATINSSGAIRGVTVNTLNDWAAIRQENSGGFLRLTKQTAAAATMSADQLKLYVRDGTNAGTLKLVVRAGTGGAETPILDNIDQSAGVLSGTIDGGSA